jgi:flagellar hook assembly protein FlgD
MVVGGRQGKVYCYSGGYDASVDIIENPVDENGIATSVSPNPFRDHTTLSIDLAKPGDCQVIIYSITGQKIHTVVNQQMQSGKHELIWDGTNGSGMELQAGIYFYRVIQGDRSAGGKITLIR